MKTLLKTVTVVSTICMFGASDIVFGSAMRLLAYYSYKATEVLYGREY
jgi:hypothetical protein